MSPAPHTLADMIREAARFGDAPFFSFVPEGQAQPRDVITFGEYVERATTLAASLDEAGVGHGSRLALYAGPHTRFVEALGAGLLVGATVFMVNNTYKRRELAAYLQSIECDAVHTDETRLPELVAARAAGNARFRILTHDPADASNRDTDVEVLQGTGARLTPRTVAPQAPSISLHTSGTTALPKAVYHSHENYMAFLRRWAEWGPSAEDRLVNFCPLYHQAGLLLTLLPALNLGIPLTQIESFSPTTFWQISDTARATVSILVPPIPSYLLNTAPTDADRTHTLEWALLAGRSDHWSEFQRRFGVVGHSGYSSTETTIFTLTGTRESPTCEEERLKNSGYLCGRPCPGWAEVRVLNDAGAAVAEGQIGRIEVRGEALFKGYLNNEQASAEAFTEDGWFRTGDSGYVSPYGDLHLVERTKDLIRRSQEQIAPAEIENTLLDHPEIAEAAVVGVPDEYREEEIRACVVLTAGSKLTAHDVASHCADNLAVFKVPRYIDIRGSLPKTANFKVKKAELVAETDANLWVSLEAR